MRTISFFPAPLPDELFYGTIGRYQKLLGYSKEIVNERLFANKTFRSGFDVTCGLTALIESLGKQYAPSSILKKHTLFYAYYPLLDSVAQNHVKDAIGEMNSKIPFLRLRLPPTPYDDNKRGIKYCPICAKNDFENYGTAYIHRSHQILYINACHIHGCRLYEYVDPQGGGLYSTLNEDYLCYEAVTAKENHVRMARLANEFINADVENIDRDRIKAKFNTLLGEKGLLTTTGRPKLQLIYGNLLVHFGPSFLSQYDAAPYTPTPEEKEFENRFNLVTSRLPDDNNRIKILHDWVWAAVGKRDVTLPLTKYLLLILFFDLTIDDFLQTKETYPELKPAKSRKSINSNNHINTLKTVEDKDVLELLKEQYEKRMLHRPNLAINLGSLFKPIGLTNYERYRTQLPLSFTYAESKCKTTDEARMERCKKVIDDFYLRGIKPTAPKVRLVAGLKAKDSLAWFETVRDKIEDYIEEKFSENTNRQ